MITELEMVLAHLKRQEDAIGTIRERFDRYLEQNRDAEGRAYDETKARETRMSLDDAIGHLLGYGEIWL